MVRAEEVRVTGALGGHMMNLELGKDLDTGPLDQGKELLL